MQAVNMDQRATDQTFFLHDDYADVFATALRCREACSGCGQLSEQMMAGITAELESMLQGRSQQLQNLTRHGCYSRNIIGEDNGWTGLICRWEAGASSIEKLPSIT